MHVSEFTLENITSYRDRTSFSLSPELNIFIGPNGGGKTNALQCLWLVLERFFFQHYTVEDKPHGREVQRADILGKQYDSYLEKATPVLDSHVLITIVPHPSDANNIRRIQDSIKQIDIEYHVLRFVKLDTITPTQLSTFDNRQPLNFIVKNNALIPPSDQSAEAAFLLYCKAIYLVTRYASFDPSFDLTAPAFFMQSTREATAGYNVNVGGLKPQGYYEARQNVTQQAGGGLSSLASQHFGRIKLKAIKAASKKAGGPSEVQLFNADHEVKLLRKYLSLLGYEWDLVERSIDSWDYVAKFRKDGRDVEPNKFSSGEREIVNFLYGIISTNVKSGIVIIDEPELHLHPKWQGMLLGLLQEFAKDRELQFVLSTHSPAFVTHRTIDAVTRIYQREGVSRRATVRSEALPDRAQLVRLVHSHNNERLFFADRVVLVEGITDRLVIENLVDKVGRWVATRETVETVEVHGKHEFARYKMILGEIDTPTLVVADLDYLVQVGGEAAKGLFRVDYGAIDERVLEAKKSKDRTTLIEVIEAAASTGQMDKVIEMVEYIKGRFNKLRDGLGEEEQRLLDEELTRALESGILIWRRGEIENYLPEGVRTVGEIVEFLGDDGWLGKLDAATRTELLDAASWILRLDEDGSADVRKKFADG